MSKYVESREGHIYEPPGKERETPVEEIPPKNRKKVPLPGGSHQILDDRLTYSLQNRRKKSKNEKPGEKKPKWRWVECGSKDASTDHDDVRRRRR